MHRRNDSAGQLLAVVCLGVACLTAVAGCSRPAGELPAKFLPESTAPQTAGGATPAALGKNTPPEPFDPPELAALDRDAKWIDRPVRDGLTLLREQLAKETPPLTLAEALALRNPSAAINGQILATLGQLPEDGAADLSARIERHLKGDHGLETGDVVVVRTAGGGGYGPACERSVSEVEDDVRLGYVSVRAARESYGVALNSEGHVDQEVTAKLRAALKNSIETKASKIKAE